jgi:release factor glutamine methyltransferase
VSRLRDAGCVAAEEEAAELAAAAGGDPDALEVLAARRCQGEPLAWLTGEVRFCGLRVAVHAGVYVPRWQTESLALGALARLPDGGTAVDLCTGAGAVAVVMARGRPSARVLATDRDPAAVACARANGVEAIECNLAAGLPPSLAGAVDVVTAVAPYVPTGLLGFLPRDVTAYEPRAALDGGADGLEVVARVVADAAGLLRSGGSLLAEIGDRQLEPLVPVLAGYGFGDPRPLLDADGDLRGVSCRRS